MNQEYRRPQINLTKDLRIPNYYTQAIDGEFGEYAFNEERAPLNKGIWRSEVFKSADDHPMDLEIGTGNGTHFQHRAVNFPNRNIIGIELKYKPLIQSIRGCLKKGATNARICRFHAMNVDLLFEHQELNDIYIHFPDPWVAPRKPKNRFVNARVLNILWDMQKPGSYLNFKTDSREYFLWSLEEIQQTKYKVISQTLDLHNSDLKEGNFITQFENIFMRQGVEINFIRLQKV